MSLGNFHGEEFQDTIPAHYFKPQTRTSLRYLLQSVLIQIVVVSIGLTIPFTQRMIPVWILYSFISGTTAMGFWVIAHECGHGAFSRNKTLETIVGYLLHSLLLVPYFSWQRSHAVHHRFTNNVTNGETHVPLVIGGNGVSENSIIFLLLPFYNYNIFFFRQFTILLFALINSAPEHHDLNVR